MWVACKKQTITRSGEDITIAPGDAVPEAASWQNLGPWIRQGFVKEVTDLLIVEVETDLNLMPPIENKPEKKEDVITVSL